MRKVVLLLIPLFLFPMAAGADKNEDLFLKVYLPRIGVIDLDGVSVSVIPSPLVVRKTDQPGETRAIPEEYKYDPQYAKAAWEKLQKRKWLSLEIKNPPTVELVIPEIPILHPGSSYSAYVSPEPENALTFGRMVGLNLRDVLFRYFTINIEASEIPKIETRRAALAESGRAKSKFKFRARLVRVETSALNLFTPGTAIIDFLDFYLTDIEFLEN